MVRRQFIPAALEYATFLADSIDDLKSVKGPAAVPEDILKKVGTVLNSAYKNLGRLETAVEKAQAVSTTVKQAESYRDKVFTALQALRGDIDSLEMLIPADTWPVPTYADLLFKL